MTYEELLEKAKEIYESEDTPHFFKAWLLANIIGPADENEDERIRKELIQLISCMNDADHRKKDWLAWLEKQGNFKMVDSSKVIEWLKHRKLSYDDVVTTVIPDDSPTSVSHRVKWLSDEFIEKFKKDFGL